MATSTHTAHDVSIGLHPEHLSPRVITGFRLVFTITGLTALILGIVLLVWPVKTVTVLAGILGIYFAVVGGSRVLAGIMSMASPPGHRLLNIVLGLLLFASGVIALKNLETSAAALLVLVVVVIGVGWIMDGVTSIAESRAARSPFWAVLFGVISIIAGLSVVAAPGWSTLWLITFCSIALIVIGLVGIIRGVTFGREPRLSS